MCGSAWKQYSVILSQSHPAWRWDQQISPLAHSVGEFRSEIGTNNSSIPYLCWFWEGDKYNKITNIFAVVGMSKLTFQV